MMSKYTYGMRVVIVSMIALLFLLICSFIVSFHGIDLLYAISIIVFFIKYIRLK